jgi:hypothetical protein
MESASALQIIDVSNWQNDLINSYHLCFKVQNNFILFHGLSAKNEVILQLAILIVLNHIQF